MDDSRTSKKRSVVASSKLGSARCTNREKLAGDQVDKSKQSVVKQSSKPPPLPAMKRKFGASPKASSPTYNFRSKDQLTEGGKDSPAYNLRSKVQKTGGENVSTSNLKRESPKSYRANDFSADIQKKGILKNSAPPVNKIVSAKPSTTSLESLDKKNDLLTSQYESLFREPMYHIRWEGDDDLENRPFGQSCIICNKDLSGVTEDDDSESNDDYQYEEDDDEEEADDDGYYDDVMPALLPAVDILPCGHAYHTECLQQGTPQEPSTDPICTFCSKLA
ncbi:uncharacterized protein [Rutidosis leptorrhynchoides]|uniref:uncharacterized protein n=1 Tax=Rutidosis leptorrhynchoides TaxID=125765 RepID=UPI003A98FA07